MKRVVIGFGLRLVGATIISVIIVWLSITPFDRVPIPRGLHIATARVLNFPVAVAGRLTRYRGLEVWPALVVVLLLLSGIHHLVADACLYPDVSLLAVRPGCDQVERETVPREAITDSRGKPLSDVLSSTHTDHCVLS